MCMMRAVQSSKSVTGVKPMNKFSYIHVVQGNYGHFGWEDVAESDTHKEARYNLREFRISSGPAPHRIIQRRVLNEPR